MSAVCSHAASAAPTASIPTLGSVLRAGVLLAWGAACTGESTATTASMLPAPIAAAPSNAPNILLISLDTLRADAIPPYGQTRDTAPAMTKLAAEGVVFERAWAQAPSTSPTHASMFTGAWPAEHGVMGPSGRLPLRWETMAEYFHAHGFRTWAVATSVRFAPGVQLNHGFEAYTAFVDLYPTKAGNLAMEVALEAMAAPSERPWLGFVHLLDVHAPYGVPEPHQSRFLAEPSVHAPRDTVDFIHTHRHSKSDVTARELRDLKDMYDGGVSFVDTRVAALRQAVAKLDRPTVIILTSDHGEAFFENGYLGHGSRVWETITRVPLILWAPGRLPQGVRRTTLAQSIDLFPTAAALAGLPPPTGGRGIDLSGVARGEGEVTGRTVLVQSPDYSAVVREVDGHLFKMVQRYHEDPDRRYIRLYDLDAHPWEKKRADETQAELKDALQAFAAENHAARYRDQREAWTRTEREESLLRAIGYMD